MKHTKKTPDTLVRDIYTLMETKDIPEGVDLDYEADRCGQEVAKILKEVMRDKRRRGLSLSGIGKPDRQLWHGYNGTKGQDIEGATAIKFLYGHLIEALLVSLTRISGHTVTDQQKTVEVNGVLGHIDGRIDGVLMDIKSCSSYGFKKFKKNTLHTDDPYGYIGQLRAYAHAEGDNTYGWLAMDKANGTIAWLQYHEGDPKAPYAKALDWSVPDRIDYLKDAVDGPLPPACYQEVPDGASGNLRLASGCVYCPFKYTCWPTVREFHYSSGPKFLTKVVYEPKVMEVPSDF